MSGISVTCNGKPIFIEKFFDHAVISIGIVQISLAFPLLEGPFNFLEGDFIFDSEIKIEISSVIVQDPDIIVNI